MDWKAALAKAVDVWATERSSRKEFYRETGGCGISTEARKKLAWERDEEIERV